MIPKQQEPQPDLSASESEPLPPLPDGGLARAMPNWLRDEPVPPPPSPTAPIAANPTTFITEDDLPDWLRQLSAAPAEPTPRVEPPPWQPPVAITPAPPVTFPNIEPSPASPSPRQLDPAPAVHYQPAPDPRSANRRRVIVAVAGVLLLALGVLAYLYATRGGF